MLPEKIRNGALTNKVHIIASPYKTGTSSVGAALLTIGVGSEIMNYDGKILSELRPVFRPFNRQADRADSFAAFVADCGNNIRKDLAPLVTAVSAYDVFHDAPFGHGHLHPFVRKVLAPHASFIWVHRDEDDWIASVRNWEESHPDLYPGHSLWSEDQDGLKEKRLTNFRNQYARFQKLAQEFPQTCLELAWDDLKSFDALAAFYNVPVPQTAFPKLNVAR